MKILNNLSVAHNRRATAQRTSAIIQKALSFFATEQAVKNAAMQELHFFRPIGTLATVHQKLIYIFRWRWRGVPIKGVRISKKMAKDLFLIPYCATHRRPECSQPLVDAKFRLYAPENALCGHLCFHFRFQSLLSLSRFTSVALRPLAFLFWAWLSCKFVQTKSPMSHFAFPLLAPLR